MNSASTGKIEWSDLIRAMAKLLRSASKKSSTIHTPVTLFLLPVSGKWSSFSAYALQPLITIFQTIQAASVVAPIEIARLAQT